MPTAEFVRPHLYEKQYQAIYNEARYAVIEAATKSGKTHGCIVWLFEKAAIEGKSNRNYWWVAPILTQAKIAYKRMREAIPRELRKTNDTELTITLPNGAVIWFKGSDRPDSLYGEDVYAAVIDEASRCRAEAWHAVRSTLTATGGPVRIIGNVKGHKNWAYRIARKAETGTPGYSYAKITAYDAAEAGVVTFEEIEDAKAALPDRVFRELYLAEASDDTGRVYCNFSAESVIATAIEDGAIIAGMDFNVNPMTAVIGQRRADQLHIVAEVVQPHSNTQTMTAHLQKTYSERRITVYPDPSGRARKTSATNTDFAILEKAGFTVKAPMAAPRVEDRINTVNAAFQTSDGTKRLFISSECSELIDALWSLYYTEKGEPDKTSGFDHICDALGYLVIAELPIKATTARRIKVEMV